MTDMFNPGTKISDYKIIKLISSDKFGEIYLASDTQLDQNVVLKFLPLDLPLDRAKKAIKLSHPNIASVLESGIHNNRNYLVMEDVNGIWFGVIP